MANQYQCNLNFIFQADSFENFRHEELKQISLEFIRAKKLLQAISEPRRHCLEELSRQKELVDWLHEALEGMADLLVSCRWHLWFCSS